MTKKIMIHAFLLIMLLTSRDVLRAADRDDDPLKGAFSSYVSSADDVLIEREFVDYFKKIAGEDGEKPITVSVRARDVYGKGEEYEDQKEFSKDVLTDSVTRSFLSGEFEALNIFLSLALRTHPSDVYEIRASIWVDAPGHKEKVNGFCIIRPNLK